MQSWFETGRGEADLASERMRKSFGVSPESASTSDQMCASSHKSDSKVIALHLKNSWKPYIRCDFKLTHPLCKPFHHCLWWSIHLARHWLRSSDGKDSVLYCSQAEVETSWLGTNREENADSIIPDPEPDCPPVMPIVVVRISWKHFDSRKIITQSLEQVFLAVIVYQAAIKMPMAGIGQTGKRLNVYFNTYRAWRGKLPWDCSIHNTRPGFGFGSNCILVSSPTTILSE